MVVAKMIVPNKRICRILRIVAIWIYIAPIFHYPANIAMGAEDEVVIRLDASTDKEEIRIGDRIRYTINVYTGPDVEIEFPEVKENLGEFSVKDRAEEKRGKPLFGKTVHTLEYILTTYDIGRRSIPSHVVRYRTKKNGSWKEAKTDAISINVRSVLAKEPSSNDIRDIKGPLSLPKNLLPFIIALLFVLAVVVYSLAKFLRRRASMEKMLPPKPPYEIACEELRRIKSSNLIEKGMIKEYYIILSDCIRHYLEGRFNLRAPEMTTEEFLLSVRESNSLPSGHKALLHDFLASSDMVKFAKYGPGREETESSFQFAWNFVDQTKPEVGGQGKTQSRRVKS